MLLEKVLKIKITGLPEVKENECIMVIIRFYVRTADMQ